MIETSFAALEETQSAVFEGKLPRSALKIFRPLEDRMWERREWENNPHDTSRLPLDISSRLHREDGWVMDQHPNFTSSDPWQQLLRGYPDGLDLSEQAAKHLNDIGYVVSPNFDDEFEFGNNPIRDPSNTTYLKRALGEPVAFDEHHKYKRFFSAIGIEDFMVGRIYRSREIDDKSLLAVFSTDGDTYFTVLNPITETLIGKYGLGFGQVQELRDNSRLIVTGVDPEGKYIPGNDRQAAFALVSNRFPEEGLMYGQRRQLFELQSAQFDGTKLRVFHLADLMDEHKTYFMLER